MQPQHIIDNIASSYPDVVAKQSFGEIAMFYNKNNQLKNGVYFLTIKTKDGPNDFLSELNKSGGFRVNFKLSKQRYCDLFIKIPKRFEELSGFNLAKQNTLLPHPVYAWMSWACIINPTQQRFNEIKFLIDESYEIAKINFEKRA